MKQTVLFFLSLCKIIVFEISVYLFLKFEYGLLVVACVITALLVIYDKLVTKHYKTSFILVLLPIAFWGWSFHFYTLIGFPMALITFLISERKCIRNLSNFIVGTTILYCYIDFSSLAYSVYSLLIAPLILCLVLPTISFILFYFTRFSVHLFGIRIYLRIITLYSIYCAVLLGVIVPFAYIYIIRGFVDVNLDNIIEVGAIIKCFLYLIEKLDDIKSPNVHFFKLEANNNIILFLRRFTYDEKYDPCLSAINNYLCQPSSNHYKVLKIADPNTLYCYATFGCEYIYLPTIDWKEALYEYINKAKFVVTILDASEGVFWEAFEHFEHKSKYIYYLPSLEQLNSIVNHDYFYKKEYNKTLLGEYLIRLSSNSFLPKECDRSKSPQYLYFENDIIIEGEDIVHIINKKEGQFDEQEKTD